MKLNAFVILSILALFIMPVSAVSMADIRAEGTVSNLTINQTIVGQMNQTPNMTPGPQGIPGINGTNGLNGTPGTTDHHLLTNLTTGDDHTQYALLSGRPGGQILNGGTTSADNLILNLNGGNVGIGTRLPGDPLAIRKDSSETTIPYDTSQVTLMNLNTTQNNYVSIRSIASDSNGVNHTYGTIENIFTNHTAGFKDSAWAFTERVNNNNIEAMRISKGNVGIGITNPLSKLQIQDGITGLRFQAINSNALMAIGMTTSDGNDNQGVIVQGGGIVESGVQERGAFIAARGNEMSGRPGNVELALGKVTGSQFLFYGGDGNEKMVINSNGNVGIGTTSPSTQLDTTGEVRFRNFGTGITTFNSTGYLSSQPYLAGTKNYYVSDTLGGIATRKLTFTNGILTAET